VRQSKQSLLYRHNSGIFEHKSQFFKDLPIFAGKSIQRVIFKAVKLIVNKQQRGIILRLPNVT